MITKFIVFSLVVTCCVAGFQPPRFIRFFGNILHNAMWKYRYIGSEQKILAADRLRDSKVVVTFPQYLHTHPNEDLVINAIQQIDHGEHQAEVEFVEGGIGANQVKMLVTVPKGAEMKTEFHFYGKKVTKLGDAEQREFMNKFIIPETDQNSFAEQDKPSEKGGAASTM